MIDHGRTEQMILEMDKLAKGESTQLWPEWQQMSGKIKGGGRSGEYSPCESSPPFAIAHSWFFFQISPADVGECCARDGK